MEKFRILHLVGYFGICVLLIGTFSIIIIHTGYRVISSEKDNSGYGENQKESVKYYEYLSLDFMNNETSVGIVKSNFVDFDDDEYKFDVTNDGKYSLISNFGSEKYLCHGYCYCEKNEEYDDNSNWRRQVSSSAAFYSSIRKGVVTLLVATTSILAYQISKNQFDNDCEDLLSESCDKNFYIRSSVEECLSLSEIAEEKKENEIIDNDESDELEHTLEEGSKYLCQGTCIANFGLLRRMQKSMSSWDLKKHHSSCDELFLEGYMILDQNIKFKGSASKRSEIELAAVHFGRTELNEFCISKSSKDTGPPKICEKSGKKQRQFEVWCVGVHIDDDGHVRMRDSVKCIKVWKTGGKWTRIFQKMNDRIKTGF